MTDIPWDKLGVPDSLRGAVEPTAPRSVRLAAAKGALPATPEALLGMLYVLACGPDPDIRSAALDTLRTMPGLTEALTQRTHTKVLELIVTTRIEPALDERISFIRAANDRTATIVAGRADAKLCEIIAANHERLLISPQVLVALHQNPLCGDAALERAIAFMRMQQSLPDLPATRPAVGDPPRAVAPIAGAAKPAEAVFDLDAEIEAALAGKASPHQVQQEKLRLFDLDAMPSGGLEGFAFDFKEDDEFSFLLTVEITDEGEILNRAESIEKQIAAMGVGKKLKLAYLGNKAVRSILIRDRNKLVALAVVKSGRLTDAEVLAHAGNRNLPAEALRELASNREWTRMYPVKVALVNNPKCPPNVAVSMVAHLQSRDLASLTRNKNVSSVVTQLAVKTSKLKSK